MIAATRFPGDIWRYRNGPRFRWRDDDTVLRRARFVPFRVRPALSRTRLV
jgi:hypothetical protein